MVRAEPLKSLTIPIHAERASRENRDDKKRYRAKQPAKQIQNPNIEIRNKLRDK
jgi:hypothetical protein